MLTRILLCYNHVIAASVLFLVMNDIIRTRISGKLATGGDRQSVGFVTAETETQNYYTTLGVKNDATKHEIHKAFRQLAKKYHPDKNKEKGAQDEFIKIFKAYETLSDETKRKEYDEQVNYGRTNNDSNNNNNNNYYQYNNFDLNDFFKQYEDQFLKHQQQHESHHNRFTFHGVDLDDLFHDIDEDELNSFGGFDHQHHFQHHHQQHNQQLHQHHQSIDGFFGDGASFFGSHLPHQMHDVLHHQTYQGGNYHQACQTTTKHVNGMIMTQTSCS